MNFSFQDIQDFLSSNQFASGGLLIGAVGGAAAYFRNLPGRAWSFFKSRFVMSVEIQGDTEIHGWINLWLSKHKYTTKSMRMVAWAQYPERAGATISEREHSKPDIAFSPAPGRHFVRHNGKWLMIDKERKEAEKQGFGRFHESVTISAFGRNRAFFESLLKEIRESATAKKGGVECYVPRYDEWDLKSRISPREIGSVVLPEGDAEKIIADAKKFLESRCWYESVGIPFRRGYLFYGTSGGGKSSLALAMASELCLKICVLSLGGPGMNDDKLLSLIQSVPPGSIVLLEDIDCAFRGTKSRSTTPENDEKNKFDHSKTTETLTLSGLLNAIDGVASSEGQIVIMTTNYKDNLDSAIVRPGRADVKLEFKNATKSQAKRLFLRFFPGEHDLADEFSGQIIDGKHSMAEVQGHLIFYRESAHEAVKNPVSAH